MKRKGGGGKVGLHYVSKYYAALLVDLGLVVVVDVELRE